MASKDDVVIDLRKGHGTAAEPGKPTTIDIPPSDVQPSGLTNTGAQAAGSPSNQAGGQSPLEKDQAQQSENNDQPGGNEEEPQGEQGPGGQPEQQQEEQQDNQDSDQGRDKKKKEEKKDDKKEDKDKKDEKKEDKEKEGQDKEGKEKENEGQGEEPAREDGPADQPEADEPGAQEPEGAEGGEPAEGEGPAEGGAEPEAGAPEAGAPEAGAGDVGAADAGLGAEGAGGAEAAGAEAAGAGAAEAGAAGTAAEAGVAGTAAVAETGAAVAAESAVVAAEGAAVIAETEVAVTGFGAFMAAGGWIVLVVVAAIILLAIIIIAIASTFSRSGSNTKIPQNKKDIDYIESSITSGRMSFLSAGDLDQIKKGNISTPSLQAISLLIDKHENVKINYSLDQKSSETDSMSPLRSNAPFEFDIASLDKIKCTDTKNKSAKAAEFDINLTANFDWNTYLAGHDGLLCAVGYYPKIESKVSNSALDTYGPGEFLINEIATMGPKAAQAKILQAAREIIDNKNNFRIDPNDKTSTVPTILTLPIAQTDPIFLQIQNSVNTANQDGKTKVFVKSDKTMPYGLHVEFFNEPTTDENFNEKQTQNWIDNQANENL